MRILDQEFEETIKKEFPKKFEEIKGKAEAAVKKIKAGEGKEYLEESVKKHPFAFVAGAFLGGLLLGSLLSRRK